MTLTELMNAVERDMAEIAPKAYWTVECIACRWTHRESRTVEFKVYHDDRVPGIGESAFYEGATPREAYDKFIAAVFQPPKPSLAEVLALVDTPAVKAVQA